MFKNIKDRDLVKFLKNQSPKLSRKQRKIVEEINSTIFMGISIEDRRKLDLITEIYFENIIDLIINK